MVEAAEWGGTIGRTSHLKAAPFQHIKGKQIPIPTANRKKFISQRVSSKTHQPSPDCPGISRSFSKGEKKVSSAAKLKSDLHTHHRPPSPHRASEPHPRILVMADRRRINGPAGTTLPPVYYGPSDEILAKQRPTRSRPASVVRQMCTWSHMRHLRC